MATAAEKEALRGGIERTHNTARDIIEKQYVQAKQDLEDQFHEDIQDNAQAKREAFTAAGLNTDGSDPQGRPTG